MKRIFLTLAILTAGFFALSALTPSYAYASAQTDICNGVGGGTATDGTCTTTGGLTVMGVIKTIVSVLSIVIGIVAVFMVIISGFKYITSGGDSNGVSSAKSTLIYAIVGLIIVALAQFLVHFVLNNVGA